MHGDVPSIVPRRNYDIRTQCLKGTCSSSELPRRLACFLPRRCAPMPRLFVHVFSGNVPWKDGYEPHYWIRSIVLVFRIERMTGFEPAISCLGSRRATTAPHPHGRAFFRIRRTAVTCCPPAERGWPASEWMPLELHRGKRFGYLHSPTLFDPSCQWSRMY